MYTELPPYMTADEDIDLWTGTYTNTDDEVWAAFTYEDDAVQFIHTDDHTQVWQGRTVVATEFDGGRLEAHYSHETNHILLVAATSHQGPPEADRTLDATEFDFPIADLPDDHLTLILETLLADWAIQNELAAPSYPGPETLDVLTEYTAGNVSTGRNTPVGDRTPQELFDVAVANVAANAHP